MKPENVTDEMWDAAYEGGGWDRREKSVVSTGLRRAIAAAINAMPPNPELDRLRAENEALKQCIQHESDVVEAAREEIIRQRVENANQSEKINALISENEALRLGWCICYSMGMGYFDDGEMWDARMAPAIDFKRDSVATIHNKMTERICFSAALQEPKP
ncbi:hypothetical protein [Petrachloros mirabilis]